MRSDLSCDVAAGTTPVGCVWSPPQRSCCACRDVTQASPSARFQAISGVRVRSGGPRRVPYPVPRAIYPSHQLQKRKHPEGGAHEAQVRSQRRHRRSHALCGAAGPRAHFRRELRHGDREPTTLRPRSRRCSGAATAAPAAGAAWDPRTEPTGARNPAPPRQRLRPSRRPRPLTQGSPVLLWVEIIKKSSDRSTETEAASLSLMSLVCWTLSRSL